MLYPDITGLGDILTGLGDILTGLDNNASVVGCEQLLQSLQKEKNNKLCSLQRYLGFYELNHNAARLIAVNV